MLPFHQSCDIIIERVSSHGRKMSVVSAVIAKIVSMQQSLTVSESEIAQYVINNVDTVATSTITAVARNTNTSEASINRFCKKIGYKGFNSFKVALAQENFYNSMQKAEPAERVVFVYGMSVV